jgi:hypothetical protein
MVLHVTVAVAVGVPHSATSGFKLRCAFFASRGSSACRIGRVGYTPSGSPITSVQIWAGQSGQAVYYENPRAGTYRLLAY